MSDTSTRGASSERLTAAPLKATTLPPSGPPVWKSALKVALATAAYVLLHSLLASRTAKRVAVRLCGERNRNGLYRVFFVAQSFAGLGALWLYSRRLPDRELYRVEGRARVLLILGQTGALAYAAAAASTVGIGQLWGLAGLAAWLRGDELILPEPEAQGPPQDTAGALVIEGPFRWSRHPLNFAPVVVLWLMPHMTVKLAAFNAVSTLYFYFGSYNEEHRLCRAYGVPYDVYRESSCPFFFPRPDRLVTPPDTGQMTEKTGPRQ